MLEKILEAIISNAALPPTEIMSAVCATFPNEPYALIKGYIYRLNKAESIRLLTLLCMK